MPKESVLYSTNSTPIPYQVQIGFHQVISASFSIYIYLASLPSTKSSHIVHEAAGQWMKGLHCTLDGGVMMAEQIKATLSDRTRPQWQFYSLK